MGDHCVTVWSDSDKQISSLDLSSAFSHQFGHFRARNDVTVAVRSRIWYFFVCKPTKLLWEIIVSHFEVILTSRSRVWTWAAHFRINLVISGLEMTSQWRLEAEFDFFCLKTNKVNMGDHFAKIWSDSDSFGARPVEKKYFYVIKHVIFSFFLNISKTLKLGFVWKLPCFWNFDFLMFWFFIFWCFPILNH